MTLDEIMKNGWKNVVPDYVKNGQTDTRMLDEIAELRQLVDSQRARIAELEYQVRNYRRAAFTSSEKSLLELGILVEAPGITRKEVQSMLKKKETVTSGYATPHRLYMMAAFAGECFFCRCQLTLFTMTVDHLIPKSKGGGNGRSNKVPACGPCNNAKGDRMPTADELERAAALRREFDNHRDGVKPKHTTEITIYAPNRGIA